MRASAYFRRGTHLRNADSRIVFAGLLLAGVLLRCVSALCSGPDLQTDMLAYWNSAVHLARTGEYVCQEDSGVYRAYRPHGAAFLLAATMRVAGINAFAPLALNFLCFVATMFCLRSIGASTVPEWWYLPPSFTRRLAE